LGTFHPISSLFLLLDEILSFKIFLDKQILHKFEGSKVQKRRIFTKKMKLHNPFIHNIYQLLIH